MERYSESYQPTGGLAAEGVINQLGRPDIEPMEVLVREAVQNCWDARRETARGIRVEVARNQLDSAQAAAVAEKVLVDPPPDLDLDETLTDGLRILHFADFGTDGLAGPTRADRLVEGATRDFVDFVRNIGQPPDKDFGGGSFGYGKAAFYIASRARTIVIDTLCESGDGGLERRLIGAALGGNHTQAGRPYTGRHWWGEIVDGVPEPVTGSEAVHAARLLGLPDREGQDGMGTTVAVVAPGIDPGDGEHTMSFIAESLVWNFWPRMMSTKGGVQQTLKVELTENGERVPVPDPRVHGRLRGFVEAMDRIRSDSAEADPMVIDHRVASQRPVQDLGRLVLQKGPVAPIDLSDGRPVPQGMRVTAAGMHHVALMRNAELVVKYMPGPEATTGRYGYSGVFRCSLDTDQAFRKAEPPTHDDWVARAVPDRTERVFVNVALDRIRTACREAAGYGNAAMVPTEGTDVPLGEFADGLARLMPGFDGPGARREAVHPARGRRRRNAPGARASSTSAANSDAWVEGDTEVASGAGPDAGSGSEGPRPSNPRPMMRVGDHPKPAVAEDGTPVMRYPFELRAKGNAVRLTAAVHVMTNDGESVEREPPLGWVAPAVRAWIDPSGEQQLGEVFVSDTPAADGSWAAEVPIQDEVVVGLDITAEALGL